jgi:hypothetical protein
MRKRRIHRSLAAKRPGRRIIPATSKLQEQLAPQESAGHPILTLQHHLGNVTVSRLIDRQLIQRDGGFTNFPSTSSPDFSPFPVHDTSRPKDMVERNWSAMATPAPGPAQPLPIAINLGPAPPAPAAPPTHSAGFECRSQSCHRPNEPAFHDWGLDFERQRMWEKLTADVAQVVGSFNQASPLIKKYNDASKDPELSDVYGVEVIGKGDMASQVEAKVVGGGQGRGGTTLGHLFGGGASVDTKDINSDIERIAKGDVNSPFVSAMIAVKAAEQDVKAESLAVSAANLDAKSAGEAVAAARFLIEENKANVEKQRSEKELAEMKEKAESLKKYVGWAIKGVVFVAGLALAPEVVIPAAAAGAAGEVAEGGKEEKKGGLPEGLGEKGAWVAEKAIDFWYASDMASLGAKIAKLSAEMQKAHEGYLNMNEMSAVDKHAAALTHVSEKMWSLKKKITDRRKAYVNLAGAAAVASHGTPQQNQKLQGIIAAIPACEAVVAASSNIVDAIQEPPYTKDSGVALGMAMNSGVTNAVWGGVEFTENLGYLRGYKLAFQAKNRLWSERLKSANEILTRLGKNRA